MSQWNGWSRLLSDYVESSLIDMPRSTSVFFLYIVHLSQPVFQFLFFLLFCSTELRIYSHDGWCDWSKTSETEGQHVILDTLSSLLPVHAGEKTASPPSISECSQKKRWNGFKSPPNPEISRKENTALNLRWIWSSYGWFVFFISVFRSYRLLIWNMIRLLYFRALFSSPLYDWGTSVKSIFGKRSK